MADTISISKADLTALVGLYDAIGHADKVYKPCQNSAFRRCLEKPRLAAYKAFASLVKPPRKGTKIDKKDAQLLADFGKALDKADTAYPRDERGNELYRNFLRSVHRAPANARLMDDIRKLITD